jgi:hypothetical protein
MPELSSEATELMRIWLDADDLPKDEANVQIAGFRIGYLATHTAGEYGALVAEAMRAVNAFRQEARNVVVEDFEV